jgi:predicted P-loop ATPase
VNHAITRVIVSEFDAAVEKQALERIRRAIGMKSREFQTLVDIIIRVYRAPKWFDNAPQTKDGEPRAIMATAVVGLTEDPAWADVIWFNEFTGMLHVRRRPPYEEPAGEECDRSWTDDDTLETLNWFQQFSLDLRKDAVFDAVALIASRNTFHPVYDYLRALKWDEKKRLKKAASKYFGCANAEYDRAVFPRWMISAVARIFKPGCKADCAIILEGDQGIGKSTALRTLAVRIEWFTDEIEELGSKDAAIQIRGIWILELAELDSMARSEVGRTKAFMSRTDDRFRPPYGKLPITVKRQVVFAGSVNDEEYLRDPTGGRRWWPLKCMKFNIEALRRDVEQLWAEAVALYEAGEPWHLDDPKLIALAGLEQDDRYIADAFETEIAAWLTNTKDTDGNPITNITVGQVLSEALKITDRAKWSRPEQTRVGACMKRLKWTKLRDSTGERAWRWYRPGHEPPFST